MTQQGPVSLDLLIRRIRENPDAVASAYIFVYGMVVELEDARDRDDPGQFLALRIQALIQELRDKITTLSFAIIENTEEAPKTPDRTAVTRDERRPLPGETPFVSRRHRQSLVPSPSTPTKPSLPRAKSKTSITPASRSTLPPPSKKT